MTLFSVSIFTFSTLIPSSHTSSVTMWKNCEADPAQANKGERSRGKVILHRSSLMSSAMLTSHNQSTTRWTVGSPNLLHTVQLNFVYHNMRNAALYVPCQLVHTGNYNRGRVSFVVRPYRRPLFPQVTVSAWVKWQHGFLFLPWIAPWLYCSLLESKFRCSRTWYITC